MNTELMQRIKVLPVGKEGFADPDMNNSVYLNLNRLKLYLAAIPTSETMLDFSHCALFWRESWIIEAIFRWIPVHITHVDLSYNDWQSENDEKVFKSLPKTVTNVDISCTGVFMQSAAILDKIFKALINTNKDRNIFCEHKSLTMRGKIFKTLPMYFGPTVSIVQKGQLTQGLVARYNRFPFDLPYLQISERLLFRPNGLTEINRQVNLPANIVSHLYSFLSRKEIGCLALSKIQNRVSKDSQTEGASYKKNHISCSIS